MICDVVASQARHTVHRQLARCTNEHSHTGLLKTSAKSASQLADNIISRTGTMFAAGALSMETQWQLTALQRLSVSNLAAKLGLQQQTMRLQVHEYLILSKSENVLLAATYTALSP